MELDQFAKLGPNDLVETNAQERIKAEKRLIEGDIESNVRYEVYLDKKLPSSYLPYEKAILQRGGRVFYTESDLPLIIHSEESLRFKESLEL